MFRAQQGIDGQHVAYNGIAPALKDVMGGQVPLLIDAIVPTGTQVQGRHRARASRSSARSARRSLPDLPTLSEQGFTRLDAAPFYGVSGSRESRPVAQQKLSSTLSKALAHAGTARQAAGTGLRRRRQHAGRVREADSRRDRALDARWCRQAASRSTDRRDCRHVLTGSPSSRNMIRLVLRNWGRTRPLHSVARTASHGSDSVTPGCARS